MALEDAAVLGELFGRSENPRDPADKRRLLAIYEQYRKPRTEMVV
jgi:2-polyprenyl-6-methoxyphenol hydroxylase-like FAD-dependent oxidoreductase